jgi:hypothetical protein
VKKSDSTSRATRKTPVFKLKSELARYVDNDELQGGRVSSSAFVPNPSEDYLSVNSIEVEPLNDIATYYCGLFKNGIGTVAIACRKVSEYNEAAKKSGIRIIFSQEECTWKCKLNDDCNDAYKYRPTRESNSHSGVEYLGKKVTYLTIKKIARRLCGNKPHIHTITT